MRLGLLVVLVACTGSPKTWEGCADAPCRQAWAVEAWRGDPEGVTARVREVADPIEQQALVGAIAEAHPGETRTLCTQLPAGAARSHCEAINNRPHLRAEVDAAGGRTTVASGATIPERIAAGAPVAFMDQVDAESWALPWGNLAQVQLLCPTNPPTRACVTSTAEAAARRGEYPVAVATCRAIDDEKWSSECVFRAAEAPLLDPSVTVTPDRVRASLEMCMGAGAWVSRCMSHLVSAIARQAPAATASGSGAAWGALGASVERGRLTLAERAPQAPHLADLFVDRTWAEAMLRSYATAARPRGIPLDHVPAVAVPHVRTAAAWRLMGDGGLDQRSLGQWTALLRTSLLDRTPQPAMPPMDLPQALRSLWIDGRTPALGGVPASAVPWVHLLGNASRAVSADDEVDAALAVIEVAAQVTPTQRRAIEDGLDHPAPVVAWTAARLKRRLEEASTRHRQEGP